MHVFVTGATGFLGFHVVVTLLKAGHTVRLGIRNPEKMHALYKAYGITITDYAIGEITDKESIDKALDGCDAVIHTAAMVSMDPKQEELMYRTNLLGTQYVIGGAVEKGIKSIIYVSSLAALMDRKAKVINESSPLTTPFNGYSRSKIDCDLYVRALINKGADIAITYPAAIIGPDDPAMSEGNEGLALFFKLCVVHTTSGQQIIDVRELANAHVKLMENQKTGLYVISGHYLPWRQYSKAINLAIHQQVRTLYTPRWLLRLAGNLIDTIGKLYPHNFPLTRDAVTFATEWVYADDTKIRNELNLHYRPVSDTFRDTAKWLVKERHINKRWADKIQ